MRFLHFKNTIFLFTLTHLSPSLGLFLIRWESIIMVDIGDIYSRKKLGHLKTISEFEGFMEENGFPKNEQNALNYAACIGLSGVPQDKQTAYLEELHKKDNRVIAGVGGLVFEPVFLPTTTPKKSPLNLGTLKNR